MTYYDPSIWVTDKTDKLVEVCENIIKLNKVADPKEKYGQCFQPTFSAQWRVTVLETGEILDLKQWADRTGKIDVDLIQESEGLRKGHYNPRKHHRNPDGQIVKPHHVHFPTEKYPRLYVQTKKYAYPSQVNGNYIETIKQFCRESNIELRGTIPFWQK